MMATINKPQDFLVHRTMPVTEDSANEIATSLRRAGFEIVECTDFNFCLDTAARAEGKHLLVKAASNVDKIDDEMASELRTIGSALEASSLIVGSKTQHGVLEENVVYERHGLPALTMETFDKVLNENDPPFIQARRGGFFVALDGGRLREARETRGLSLGELAERVGVTRRAIYEYERMGMSAALPTVERIERVLETDVALPQDVLNWKGDKPETPPSPATGEKKDLVESLNLAGFRAYPLAQAPFDIVAKEADSKIGILQEESLSRNRSLGQVRVAKTIAQFLDTLFMVITRREIGDEIEGVPVVAEKVLKRARDPEAVVELAKQN